MHSMLTRLQIDWSENRTLAYANALLFLVWFVAYWLIEWDAEDGPVWDLLRFTLPLIGLLVCLKAVKQSMETRFREVKCLKVTLLTGSLPFTLWAIHWIFIVM